jgi:hypothetical protein
MEDISVMEDLDPESASGPGSARRWHLFELVMGLVLLAAVVGWSGFTWWRDETNRLDYEQAQKAASQHEWDVAQARYAAAGGYKDSAARAALASGKLRERDAQYKLASQFQKSGLPARAYQAARVVQTIQPGYKNIDSIAAQLEQRVYNDALGGAIVMRKGAGPSGLYYRGTNGWIWLRDSDGWSMVVGASCGDRVIYDVPGPGWDPNLAPTPMPNGYQMPEGSPTMKGRRLMSVRLAAAPAGSQSATRAAPQFDSLSLNPADYNQYICGDAGVWGARYNRFAKEIDIPKSSLGSQTYTYEAFGSALTSTVAFAGGQGTVVDLGKRGHRVLLAGYGQPQDNSAVQQLYVASPDGSNPRVVYSTTGVIIDAALSPDERRVLVISAQPSGQAATQLTADLIDEESALPRKTVARAIIDMPFGPDVGRSLLGWLEVSGVFLQRGVFQGKLLVTWPNGNKVSLVLLDPAQPEVPLLATNIDEAVRSYIVVYESPDGATLILKDRARSFSGLSNQAAVSYVTVIRAGPGATANESIKSATIGNYGIALGPGARARYGRPLSLQDLALRNDCLIYETQTRSRDRQGLLAYLLPLADLGKPSANPTQLLNISTPPGRGQNTGLSLQRHYGLSMFAYTDNVGTLHARLYTSGSDLDLALEKDIGPIYTLNGGDFAGALQ